VRKGKRQTDVMLAKFEQAIAKPVSSVLLYNESDGNVSTVNFFNFVLSTSSRLRNIRRQWSSHRLSACGDFVVIVCRPGQSMVEKVIRKLVTIRKESI